MRSAPGVRSTLAFITALVALVAITAPGAARAAAQRDDAQGIVEQHGDDVERFALVIGNNRSLNAARPDLRYADDDAVRLARLLRDVGGVHAVVLTRPDTSTAVGAGEVAGAPTRSALDATAQLLAVSIAGARAHGRRTSLVFAFAGHGDVVDGKGTLELEDDALFPDDVRALLDVVDADENHLLFDSCNSFFVVHPRRPGGRSFATRHDTTNGLKTTKRGVPHVFLSTSAEAQVWEWSQLEGGIFSHAVRSGLAGAADSDRDSAVTYGELRAFVENAVADIDGEIYKPRLFLSDASDDVVLLRLRGGRALELAGFAGRVTVRDARGVRILDVHPSPGFAPVVHLARGVGGEHEALEVVAEMQSDGRVVLTTLEVAPADGPSEDVVRVEPAHLAVGNTPRGTSTALERLFARPFGPEVFAAHAATRARVGDVGDAIDDVYGLTIAQERRIGLQLDVFARDARTRRLGIVAEGGVASLATAGYLAGIAAGLPDPRLFMQPDVMLANAAAVALPLAFVAPFAIVPSTEERIASAFVAAPHTTQRERMLRASRAVAAYDEAAANEAVDRWTSALVLVGGGVLVGAFGALLTQAEISFIENGEDAGSVPFTELRALGAGVVASGVGLVGAGVTLPFWFTSPRETLQALQASDPDPLLIVTPPGDAAP